MYPIQRMRRYRQSSSIRNLFQDVQLKASDLIAPLFVTEPGVNSTITTMPYTRRFSIDEICAEVQRLTALGIVCFALFPIINESLKTHTCQEAWNPEGLIPRTISRIKNAVPNCVLIADIALDPYHIEGHDGLIDENGAIDNDATITALCKQSLCYARAGADILGPSDMMDGRIGVIREALEKEKLISPLIMSYCAKFCSTFYGPFRDAVDSSRFLGKKDKASYQMDFQSLFQIEREIAQDCQEGADILLIKPGSHYLDVILRAKTSQPLYPIWSYH
ncbi:MAG: porphobilinogen synthase, partial [Gammaproteobacteria bacterium]|nr:porphobilinogen synthase [Gammaproteobacteria bacterium]